MLQENGHPHIALHDLPFTPAWKSERRSIACSIESKAFSRSYRDKWKNHFYKMKGDVGMSGHEKERKQEDAYTKIQTHS